MSDTPNPGSDEAIEQGCACPVMDNHHGDPQLGETRGFWITMGCPIHDASATFTAHPATPGAGDPHD